MKFGISLFSKHTGEPVAILGAQFATLEERQAFIDKNVCTRCNRTEVIFIHDGAEWHDRHIGFVYPNRNTERPSCQQ